MKNIRTISMGAAILAGAVGLIPTMLIFFGGESMVDGAAGSAILITEILFIVTIGLALFSAGLGMAINLQASKAPRSVSEYCSRWYL